MPGDAAGLSEQFVANVRGFGEVGERWLESLPGVVRACERRWDIRVLEPFDLTYHYVAAAERADGSAAVLKVGIPGVPGFGREVAALRVFAGHGVCHLLDVDEVARAMLLERVVPGTPLSEVADDELATAIVAEVAGKISKPLPPDHPFGSVAELAESIGRYRSRFGRLGGPVPATMVDRAATLVDHLLRTSAEPMLTHGDLHQDNILRSSSRGWLAIDPKGIAAEPAYEVAAMIRNPYLRLRVVDDLEPLLRRRLTRLAATLGHDVYRLRDWCLAQTTLVAVTSAQGGAKSPDHAIRVAEALAAMSI